MLPTEKSIRFESGAFSNVGTVLTLMGQYHCWTNFLDKIFKKIQTTLEFIVLFIESKNIFLKLLDWMIL